MSEPAIELRGVTKRFAGSETAAVESLDLTVERGELVVFVGPSGCGKTTTLRMINRLEEPTSGEILVNDVVADGLGDEFPIVPLGERVIPGIVTPITVFRVRRVFDLDDIPLSLTE